MSDVTLESPYLADGIQLKGNLHTHTTRSDGVADPQEMIALYASLGHDFLMLSDHDVFGVPDGLDPHGMVLISGTEISAAGPHLLDVGARTHVKPLPQRQNVIDAVNETSGIPVLCHPNWTENFNHYTLELLLSLKNYAGIEIFNGVVIDLPGSHLSTDKWDRLLTAGRKIWGFANDDAHRPHQAGQGWNVVLAKERSAEAILGAMRTGSFYPSSGVTIERIACEGPVLHVVAPDAQAIWVFGEYGRRLVRVEGGELRFDASEVAGPYIRFECYGEGGRAAWSQPIRIRGGRHETLRQRFESLEARERPTLDVLHADHPPKLTGRLSDPLWERAESSSNFLRIGDGEPSKVSTELRAITDGESLWVGVFCEETDVDKIRTKASAENPGSVWSDDSVEVFIDVEGTGRDYIQVLVNAAGYLQAVAPQSGRVLSDAVRAAAARVKGGWAVEVMIPLSELKGATAPGTTWRFHVCRNRRPVLENLVWSWVGTTNHSPERFGSLVF